MGYEDRRFRKIPESMWLFGLCIVLYAPTTGLWWALPASVLCLVPVMTPTRLVCCLYPNDEDWIARIKLGFVMMGVILVSVFVCCYMFVLPRPGSV